MLCRGLGTQLPRKANWFYLDAVREYLLSDSLDLVELEQCRDDCKLALAGNTADPSAKFLVQLVKALQYKNICHSFIYLDVVEVVPTYTRLHTFFLLLHPT